MDNMFFWGGLAILVAIFVIAALVKKKKSVAQKQNDPSDIYPMWGGSRPRPMTGKEHPVGQY